MTINTAGVGQRIATFMAVAVLLLSLASPALAQTPARGQAPATGASVQGQNWWNLGERVVPERGKFTELKSLKKVYVDVSFSSDAIQSIATDRLNIERNQIHKAIVDLIHTNSNLQVVSGGILADLAMLVRVSTEEASEPTRTNFSLTLDAETATAVEVTVLIPGSKRSDGSVRPRQVWQELSPNGQTEPTAASRFVVDGFLWEFKKLTESKKK